MKTVSTLSDTPVLEQMPVTLQLLHWLFSLSSSLTQSNKDKYNITELSVKISNYLLSYQMLTPPTKFISMFRSLYGMVTTQKHNQLHSKWFFLYYSSIDYVNQTQSEFHSLPFAS